MSVTRHVIEDLIPVYLAGDASGDTKRLVEEFLAGDPEVARQVEEQRRAYSLPPVQAELTPGAAVEVRALEKTKAHLRKRSRLQAFAILFTGLPLAFVYQHGRVAWTMWRDAPTEALIFLLCALGCWVAWFAGGRRLRAGL